MQQNGLRLSFEPWSPEYNTSLYADTTAPTSSEDVDLTAELELWDKVRPGAYRVDFSALYFIDGRRRLEGRVWNKLPDGTLAAGLLGALAVGVVTTKHDSLTPAKVVDRRLERHLILSGGVGANLIIENRSHEYGRLEYVYEPFSDTQNLENGLVQRLQFLMRQAEDRMSGGLALEQALLVLDGPLQRRAPERSMGYVKTLHQLYVAGEQLEVLSQLEKGERTPIFRIDSRVLPRYSWYVRLERTPDYVHPFAGLVRLEVRDSLGLTWAQAVADWSCRVLPRYSAKAFRDPRAPQQLMPVAFLESDLGRRMGDMAIIRRRIQAHLRGMNAREEVFEPEREIN
ncbi:MAG: hypothetical protein ACK41E_10755 [Deinococcales bacterium]